MGVYANGKLVYGFIRNDEAEPLFSQIENLSCEKRELSEDDTEEISFEEHFAEEQTKHGISLYTVGYAGVDIIEAFSVSASGKNFDVNAILSLDLAKDHMYDKNISAFFEEIGVISLLRAGWYILGYMD